MFQEQSGTYLHASGRLLVLVLRIDQAGCRSSSTSISTLPQTPNVLERLTTIAPPGGLKEKKQQKWKAKKETEEQHLKTPSSP